VKKLYRIFIIFLISYVAVYMLVNEAPLYLVGGAIVASISELPNVSNEIGTMVWGAFILGIVWGYLKVQSKPAKYALIIVLFAMLYIIDLIFAGIVTYDTVNKRVLVLTISLLIKSSILTFLIYKDKQLSTWDI